MDIEVFKNSVINESELSKLSKNMDKITNPEELDKPIAKELTEVKGCPIEGNGGKWDGQRGNSTWLPNRDEIPKNPLTNPDGLTWDEILDKYGIDGIKFKFGEPDFSLVIKGTVKIDNFTENRYGKGGNFDQACEKLAEQRHCTKEEIKTWMKENNYTWHERSDCKTMDKVPIEVHGNIRHSGGISEAKQISFIGGLGISNIQHITGTQKISEAGRKEIEAKSLESKARKLEQEGHSGKAADYRSQASTMRSRAKVLRNEGEKLIKESKGK